MSPTLAPAVVGHEPGDDPDARVERARALLSGRAVAEPLPVLPAVAAALARLFPGREAPRFQREYTVLQSLYGGLAVATFRQPANGELAVLAADATVVGHLLRHLTSEEVGKLVIEYPDEWGAAAEETAPTRSGLPRPTSGAVS